MSLYLVTFFGYSPDKRAQSHLEPLAVAANATQGDAARLDIVLLTLVNLFRVYNNQIYDAGIRRRIHASLERRWRQTDQPIFILAVVLNPELRTRCFAPNSTYRTFAKLWKIVIATYKRIFDTTESPNNEFRTAFREYISSQGDWSDENFDLDYHRSCATKLVSTRFLL